MPTPTRILTPFQRMAARDLKAAALAISQGMDLCAISLALDALCSLTAPASEGREMTSDARETLVGGLDYSREARAINGASDRLLNDLPTLWAPVRDLRKEIEGS